MTYQPKTTAEQRKELVQYLCNVNHRGAKVQRIVDDLAACEAALAERQEILRSYLMELAKAEARIAALEQRHQWRDIETAPKLVDVLTITSDGQCRVLYLTNNGEGLSDNWRWPRLGTAAEVWPSHWKPLPQPPERSV